MASPVLSAARRRVPVASHIPTYWPPTTTTHDDPDRVVFLAGPHSVIVHWQRKGGQKRRNVPCEGENNCVHCEAESKTERGIELREYWYTPAIVMKANGPIENRRWVRVLFSMTGVGGDKCGFKKSGESRVERGAYFEFARLINGNSAGLDPRFIKEVHRLDEPSFDVMPLLSNVWYPSQESRSNLLALLRTLPPEVTPPVIDAPRIHVPEPEEKPLTAAELKSLLNQGWFKKEPEPTPPPAAPPVPAEVLAELEQLRRRDAERELEIERLRKETLAAKRAQDAAVKISEEVLAKNREKPALSHDGKTIPIPPDPKPNPEPIGDSLRGMPRNERGAA